jgi:hypothetical protein
MAVKQDEVTGASELHGSLELNKSQLERQLRQRDVECSQMALELRVSFNFILLTRLS